MDYVAIDAPTTSTPRSQRSPPAAATAPTSPCRYKQRAAFACAALTRSRAARRRGQHADPSRRCTGTATTPTAPAWCATSPVAIGSTCANAARCCSAPAAARAASRRRCSMPASATCTSSTAIPERADALADALGEPGPRAFALCRRPASHGRVRPDRQCDVGRARGALPVLADVAGRPAYHRRRPELRRGGDRRSCRGRVPAACRERSTAWACWSSRPPKVSSSGTACVRKPMRSTTQLRAADARPGIRGLTMQCRAGCGACCIAPSITSADTGHAASASRRACRCVQLDDAYRCRLFGRPERPSVLRVVAAGARHVRRRSRRRAATHRGTASWRRCPSAHSDSGMIALARRIGQVVVLQPHVVLRAVVQRLDFGVAEHPHAASPDCPATTRLRRLPCPARPARRRRRNRVCARSQPSSTIAPMPISTASSIRQACTIALWPMVTSLADDGGEAAEFRVRAVVADVHHAAVLDVGARADADEVDVAAHDGARPDRTSSPSSTSPMSVAGGIDVDRSPRLRHVAEIGAHVHRRILDESPGDSPGAYTGGAPVYTPAMDSRSRHAESATPRWPACAPRISASPPDYAQRRDDLAPSARRVPAADRSDAQRHQRRLRPSLAHENLVSARA